MKEVNEKEKNVPNRWYINSLTISHHYFIWPCITLCINQVVRIKCHMVTNYWVKILERFWLDFARGRYGDGWYEISCEILAKIGGEENDIG